MTLGNGERDSEVVPLSVFVVEVEAEVVLETEGELDPPPFNNNSSVVIEAIGEAVVEWEAEAQEEVLIVADDEPVSEKEKKTTLGDAVWVFVNVCDSDVVPVEVLHALWLGESVLLDVLLKR